MQYPPGGCVASSGVPADLAYVRPPVQKALPSRGFYLPLKLPSGLAHTTVKETSFL